MHAILGLFCTLVAVAASSSAPKLKLSSGYEIPVVGLGTWQLEKEAVDKAINAALDNGYTYIDTAFVYNNEEEIGQSLKKYFDKGGKRESLFITTKLPIFAVRASDVERYLKLSLKNLGLEYVDLYLIHAPAGIVADKDGKIVENEDGSVVLDDSTDLIATWKAMEDQVKAGLVKSIGLSNFNESQISSIIENSEIKPSNLQVELQAYNQQRRLREFCNQHNISITAYSSLGSSASRSLVTDTARELTNLLEHPIVKKIADDRNKTTAQVLLRHQVQEGIIVIPKSSNPDRIKANMDIFDFELTEDELRQLDSLDRGEDGRLFDFLCFHKGLDKHPLYPFIAYLSRDTQKTHEPK
ncbi:hypothetical protein QAD02_001405 [Eretmocerus hayati]|uniref:Uncharacterized protein n=1 Tax=Eretmocerus hayati TaxID=131215 RepID=A0ACC2NGD7_9HYME|nr:hypothetical protein QAD02_001405 [Eretmocerus hayati]